MLKKKFNSKKGLISIEGVIILSAITIVFALLFGCISLNQDDYSKNNNYDMDFIIF